jgi:hypothetical protein
MCVILYNPKGVAYNEREIRNACATNDDGFGIMWVQDGQVKTFKGILSADDVVETVKEFTGIPSVVHLRFATHGPIVPNLCHPFRVTPEGATQTVFMMHNGVLYEHGNRAENHESDTLVFARDRQKDISVFKQEGSDETDLFFNDDYVQYMENMISGDRMIFLRDDGSVRVLSQKNWHVDEETGIWYSNRYSVQDRPKYNPRSWASMAASWMGADDDDETVNLSDSKTDDDINKRAEEEYAAWFSAELDMKDPSDKQTGTSIVKVGSSPIITPAPAPNSPDQQMFYFKWDESTREFMLCDYESSEIEVSAAEFFQRMEQNEQDTTVTLFQVGLERAQAENDSSKSDRYHDLINDFLNEYQEGVEANNKPN